MSFTLRVALAAPVRGGMGAALLFLIAGASSAVAQSSKPARQAQAAQSTLDARWTPWLGCWRSDASSPSAPATATTCVIPLSGTTGVEELSIANGKIVERRRFEADGRPHPMQESACKGTRTSQWSPGGRRVYVRSEYTCDAGFSGVSTSIIALSSTGDFIESEHVKAGRGSVEHITHLRDAGLPDGVPSEVMAALAPRRLAITTARAAAIAPLASDDVLEALQQVDAAAVRAWLTENGQRFTLNGDQIAALIRSDVPQSVLQAMVGWAPQQNAGQPGMGQEVYTTRSNTGGGIVVYGSAPMQAQPASNGLYCNASGCYSENPYSGFNGYNGFVYSPYQDGYPYYPYNGFYPYGLGFPSVIVNNGSRLGHNRFNGPFGINKPVVGRPGGLPMNRGGQPGPRGGQPPVNRPVGTPVRGRP
ncbi:MAG TPA: hypothetical protein VNS10_12155 [Gemmatimonadaceae bacterium]|jgi:hypothetical protein|nr:hypothetical protein [Gemmatimonadaceae bacterium]